MTYRLMSFKHVAAAVSFTVKYKGRKVSDPSFNAMLLLLCVLKGNKKSPDRCYSGVGGCVSIRQEQHQASNNIRLNFS